MKRGLLLLGCLISLHSARGWEAPVIRRTDPVRGLHRPAHHGLYVYIQPIADPNLSFFKVYLSRDHGGNWNLYSDRLKPYNTERLLFFFRGDQYAFATGIEYLLKLCAVYGQEGEFCSETPFRFPELAGGEEEDTDDDGLTDGEEYNFGTDPLNPDSDGDDMSDRVEFVYGADPNRTERPELLAEETELAFGNGNAFGDDPGQHRRIVLTNPGERPLRIHNILLESQPGGIFRLADEFQLLRQIEAGGRVELPIDYLPTKPGGGSGTVTLLSDDRAHFPYTIRLSGAGTNIANMLVHVEPGEIRFPETPVGGTSAELRIPVANTDADIPLRVNIFTEYVHNVTVTPETFEVAPENVQWVRVQFLPEWTGSTEGALRVQGLNDSGFREVHVPLRASASGAEPRMRVAARALNFPDTAPGAKSARRILIHNDGEGPLYVKQIDFGEGDRAPFHVLPEQLLIPPGGQRFADVTFQPNARGEFRTSLCIVSNDPAVGEEGGCNIARPVAGGIFLPREAKTVVLTGRGI